MNLVQFKDPVSHMCLAGTVVVSWSLTQEVTASNPFTVMTNILSLNLLNSVKTFRKNANVSDQFVKTVVATYFRPIRIDFKSEKAV